MTEQKIYHGTCLCAQTQFILTGEPFHFIVCHCRNCKQASGSAFLAGAMFKPQQVKVTKGEDLITEYGDSNTLSGNTVGRSFCSKCGSCLFSKPAGWNIVIIHPSTIQEAVTWVPIEERYGQDKWHWVKEIAFQTKKRPAKL